MKLAARTVGPQVGFGLAVLFTVAGCTLSGSKGLGDVTPVGAAVPDGGGESAGVVTLVPAEPATDVIPSDSEPVLSDLEVIGTQAALDATAQASAAITGATGADGETVIGGADSGDLITSPGIVTSEAGGEILPPTSTVAAPSSGDTSSGSQSGDCPSTHTVAQGENMYRIALQFNTTHQELAAANGIINPDQVSEGTVLSIPGCDGTAATTTGTASGAATASGVTYTVQAGDNLYRIALQFNLPWTTLAAFNGIANPDVLFVGQELQIPQ